MCPCIAEGSSCHVKAGRTVLGLTVITFALSIVVLSSCRILSLETFYSPSVRDGVYLGLYRGDHNTDSCKTYASDFFTGFGKDPMFSNIARGSAIATVLMQGLSLVAASMAISIPIQPSLKIIVWRTMAVLSILSVPTSLGVIALYAIQLCSLTTELFWCDPAPGTYILGANIILLMMVSIIACATPAPARTKADERSHRGDNNKTHDAVELLETRKQHHPVHDEAFTSAAEDN